MAELRRSRALCRWARRDPLCDGIERVAGAAVLFFAFGFFAAVFAVFRIINRDWEDEKDAVGGGMRKGLSWPIRGEEVVAPRVW